MESLTRWFDHHEGVLVQFRLNRTGVRNALLFADWLALNVINRDADQLAFCERETQVCGCVSSRRIDEVPDNVFKESSRINSTWGGNLTDMVRSTIYLEIIKEENLLDAAADQGKYLKTHMQSLQEEFPELVINPRGLGLMCAFDLPTVAQRDDLAGKIIENGVFILGSGEKAIRFRPPLNISRDELDTGMEIVRTSMKQLY